MDRPLSAPLLALTALLLACAALAQPVATYVVAGDEIRAPLAGIQGDAGRGRLVVLERDQGACLLCHSVPEPVPFMGDLAPSLAGVGGRLTPGQLRLRIVDSSRLNQASIMPSYYRIDGLSEVDPAWRGKPILSAQQIEDAIAYLRELK